MLKLKPRLSSDGQLTPTPRGWKFWIPAGPAHRYRLSQLDDHLGIGRRDYPRRPPFKMSLEAKASAPALPGTWGFGLWNDPYGFSIGPGGGLLRLPAAPNAVWFFFSSPTNYLTFRNDRPGNGLLAQLFTSAGFNSLFWRAIATIPFAPRTAREMISRVILEDEIQIDADSGSEAAVPARLDVTQWHKYDLIWAKNSTTFLVDEKTVLESPLSPRAPMGIVIWLDNQFAGFTPQGKLSWGLEVNPEPAWLEIRDLSIDET